MHHASASASQHHMCSIVRGAMGSGGFVASYPPGSSRARRCRLVHLYERGRKLCALEVHLQLLMLPLGLLADLSREGRVVKHDVDLLELRLKLRDAVGEHLGIVIVRVWLLVGVEVLLLFLRLGLFRGSVL